MILDVLFWNIKNRGQLGKIKPAIRDLYQKFKPQLFLLIESDLSDIEAEHLFDNELRAVASTNSKKSVHLFAHSSLIIHEVNDKDIPFVGATIQLNNRVVTFKLTHKGQDILFFGTHFPSKYTFDRNVQYKIMREWQGHIKSQETLLKTEKSIVFGDLNLNPFDDALYQDDAIYAHPVISNHTTYRPAFYNPMWSLMGDFIYKTNKEKVPGSYYFVPSKNSVGEFHWNCIDGVLVKTCIAENFVKKELQIITSVKRHKFSDNHQIFDTEYSDHLPIKFQLNL